MDDGVIGLHALASAYKQRPDLSINTTLALFKTDEM